MCDRLPQTIDELEVSKPCIDMEDEGYNVEWSQELKVFQSFDEYLRAWILIHALHKKFEFPGDAPGLVFNLSVGYNLEGIQKPNVQWFLKQMQDCSEYKDAYVDLVAQYLPEVRDIEIPDRMSDSITLSTMHGCPPDELARVLGILRGAGLEPSAVDLDATALYSAYEAVGGYREVLYYAQDIDLTTRLEEGLLLVERWHTWNAYARSYWNGSHTGT